MQEISVSDLKTHLLEVMRKVEAGTSYKVTKSNKPIALISGLANESLPFASFAKIKVHTDSKVLNEGDWTFDAHNVK
jgi:prevent-host-death family protein